VLIVKGKLYARINAEELGVFKEHRRGAKSEEAQVDAAGRQPKAPMAKSWADQGLEAFASCNVGNYGESYEPQCRIGIKAEDSRRGLNQLWTPGGIQYAPPIR